MPRMWPGVHTADCTPRLSQFASELDAAKGKNQFHLGLLRFFFFFFFFFCVCVCACFFFLTLPFAVTDVASSGAGLVVLFSCSPDTAFLSCFSSRCWCLDSLTRRPWCATLSSC